MKLTTPSLLLTNTSPASLFQPDSFLSSSLVAPAPTPAETPPPP